MKSGGKLLSVRCWAGVLGRAVARSWTALVLAATLVLPAAALAAPVAEARGDGGPPPPEAMVVRVGVSGEFPPYYFSGSAGRYEGFVADLMERLTQGTGLRLEYHRYGAFREVLDALQRGEVDMTPFTSETAQRHAYLRFIKPMFATQTVVVADRRLPDLSMDETFSRYRVAVERESAAAELLRRHYPQALVQHFDTVEQAIVATASGHADLCLTFRQVAVYYMEKHFTANLGLRGALGAQGTTLGPAVRKDLPRLAGILDEAVGRLTTEDVARLTLKWLPRSVIEPPAGPVAPLSEAQRAWVRQRGGVRLGFDAAFSPISFADVAGGFDGMAADITRLVARKAGLLVSLEQSGSFADVLDKARNGQIDIVVGAARNAERSRDFDFVGPLLRVPTVVIAAQSQQLGDGLDTPGARRVALLKQHFLLPLLRSRHPGLQLLEYDTQAEVLQAVRRGEADLALGNMKVVNQLLEARHVGALKTVGIVPHGDSELYFAVPRSQPELTAILRSALDAATPAELAAIEDRWLRVEFSAGISWRRVLAFGAAALLVVAAVVGSLLISNRRLREGNQAFAATRRSAEEQVQARARFIAYLSHELRGSLGGLSGGLAMMEAGTLPQARVAMLTSAMRTSASTLLDLCERTLDIERWLRGGVDLAPVPVELARVLEGAVAPWAVQAELKGLALRSECRFSPSHRVECDPLRLTQVVQNLLGNAVKFTMQGEVALIAALEPMPGAAPGSLQLSVQVVDTGPGIPEADRARLFEPFGQGQAGRTNRTGAGLGLSIVAQIAAAMGGTVRVEQSTPQGSVFRVDVLVRDLGGAAPQAAM